MLFGRQAEVAAEYLKKGRSVYIEGRLQTRKYTDKDNVEKYTTEVVLRPYRGELTLLDSKKDGSGAANDYEDAPRAASGGGGGSFGGGQGGGSSPMDDEIPF